MQRRSGMAKLGPSMQHMLTACELLDLCKLRPTDPSGRCADAAAGGGTRGVRARHSGGSGNSAEDRLRPRKVGDVSGGGGQLGRTRRRRWRRWGKVGGLVGRPEKVQVLAPVLGAGGGGCSERVGWGTQLSRQDGWLRRRRHRWLGGRLRARELGRAHLRVLPCLQDHVQGGQRAGGRHVPRAWQDVSSVQQP
jgi:hypothetical protein